MQRWGRLAKLKGGAVSTRTPIMLPTVIIGIVGALCECPLARKYGSENGQSMGF